MHVNNVGQIPSHFNLDVTGVLNYKQRKQLLSDDRMSAEQGLFMKVETPKSLANINEKKH